MFEETESVLNTKSVRSNISYLQNLQFTDAKFLLWSQKLWYKYKPGYINNMIGFHTTKMLIVCDSLFRKCILVSFVMASWRTDVFF